MVSTILLVFFSLIGLIIIHELGHFLCAKKFGVKVEEFGMFLPPRIWGKQIGETLYSINWIPAGAFVKLQGEDSADKSDPRSFGSKPIWQRMIIIAAGVISFWLISVIILSGVYASSAIKGADDSDLISDGKVQITLVSADSPAFAAGLKLGDFIETIKIKEQQNAPVQIDKVAQVQEIANSNGGKELLLGIKRGQQPLEITLSPRQNPTDGKGYMGIGLARTTQKSYVWWQAIGNGFTATWNMTIGVFEGWGQVNWGEAIGRLFKTEKTSSGAQLVGPVGIMQMMVNRAEMGMSYYLQFVAMLSVYLAVFNALPIPALDGGRLMFLIIEAIRRKPVPEKIEQSLTMFFFGLLMLFAIIVTINDVKNLPVVAKFISNLRASI